MGTNQDGRNAPQGDGSSPNNGLKNKRTRKGLKNKRPIPPTMRGTEMTERTLEELKQEGASLREMIERALEELKQEQALEELKQKRALEQEQCKHEKTYPLTASGYVYCLQCSKHCPAE